MAQYENIMPDEIEKQLKDKKLSIIDVREHDEVARGKIPGARHIPLGELQARLHEIEKDQEHIMVCHSGARSSMASDFLHRQGFKVKNMIGGMMNWRGKVEG